MHRASKPLEDTQQASCLEATQQTVPQPNITAFYRNLCSLPQTKNLHRLISWRPRFGESGSHWSHFEWPELSWPDLPSAFNEGVRSRQTKRLIQFFKELLWLKMRTRSLQKQVLQCNSDFILVHWSGIDNDSYYIMLMNNMKPEHRSTSLRMVQRFHLGWCQFLLITNY